MIRKFIVASFAGLCFWACSNDSVAGGVSEETNTLAGILVDASGNAVSRALVSARHFDLDSVVLTDSTDESGRFALPLERRGRYGLSAQSERGSFYKMLDFEGLSDSVRAELSPTGSVDGIVKFSNDSVAASVQVLIPGSPWKTVSDSNGHFTVEGVPLGNHPLKALSPDPIQYVDGNYMVWVNADSSLLFGPISDERLGKSAGESSNAVYLPVSTEYGLRSWWGMDYQTVAKNHVSSIGDARGWSESMLVYGDGALSEGVEGRSLVLRGSSQYGVVENDRGLLEGASSMFLEAWVRVDSIDSKEKIYRKNVVGKVGFGSKDDRDVFSLAVVEGDCGAIAASFAFFLADGSGDSLSCKNAVLADTPLKLKRWTYVVAVWDGVYSKLYIDGKLSARKEVSITQIGNSEEPIFFGKESLNLELDDVRIGVSALGNADVMYRYNLKEVQDD